MRWPCLLAPSVLASLLVGLTPVAHAQAGEGSASMSAAARPLYQEGVEAVQEGRLEDAIDAFVRCYALSPRSATLWNLAQVQERAGQLVDALDTYRRFLARADADLLDRLGSRAEAAVAALEERMGHLVVTVDDLDPHDEVRLDGVVLSPATFGLDLPVDPAAHVVTVYRGEVECVSRAFSLAEGARREVTLDHDALDEACRTPLAAGSASTARAGEDPTGWIVLGVVGGGAVIAGLVVGILFATAPQPAAPFVGNVGPGTFLAP